MKEILAERKSQRKVSITRKKAKKKNEKYKERRD
jgi:hypothetical protein